MKDTIKNKIIAIIIAIVIISFFFYITDVKDSKLENKLSLEFPYLKLSDSLNNIIISTYYPHNWRGGSIFQCVTLDNGNKYTISASTQASYNLEVLQKSNIRIKKKANNDTIWVYDGSEKYVFIYFNNE
jgi:hypothetical protein